MSEFTNPEMNVGSSNVGAFWQWAFSSLADNATRGVFAEYLVGLALDAVDQPRAEWDAADLLFLGRRIEVKSSADHQVWKQAKPSRIEFDIRRKRSWDAQENSIGRVAGRPADVYVFCHYHGPATSFGVVDTDNWDFYLLRTTTIDAELGDQKRLGLRRLQTLCNPITFDRLRPEIEAMLTI